MEEAQIFIGGMKTGLLMRGGEIWVLNTRAGALPGLSLAHLRACADVAAATSNLNIKRWKQTCRSRLLMEENIK